MQTSQDLILTTHVGSLPRTDAVVELLERRESGGDLDEAALTIVQRSVADIVSRQVEIGIDVVSDGETTKMSYATYVKDRLTGFSEEGPTKAARPHLDVAPFPDFQRKMELLTGARRFKRVSCVGPVAVRDSAALQRDLVNMKLATARVQPIDAFLNAASPGVVASFLPNQYYTSHEAYVEAVANAMSEEYRAIVTAGFVIQIDCPDLAMSRHTAFQDLTEAEFLKRAQFHVEALNHALTGIPSDKVRIHVCWGNYEGPHTHDIDLAKILKTILALNAQGLSLEAANPRHEHEWTIWRDIKLPADKVLLPGVIDTSTNYVEHPDLVARVSLPAPIAASVRRLATAKSIRRLPSSSWVRWWPALRAPASTCGDRQLLQSSRLASLAPSTNDRSLAHATSGCTSSPAPEVPKPQSVPAMTRSRPTTFAKRTMRCATSSGCSTK